MTFHYSPKDWSSIRSNKLAPIVPEFLPYNSLIIKNLFSVHTDIVCLQFEINPDILVKNLGLVYIHTIVSTVQNKTATLVEK